MEGGIAPGEDTVFDNAMAGQECAAGKGTMIADGDIMGDMGIGHDEVVVADSGRLIVRSCAMNGDAFANQIALADYDACACLLGIPGNILGGETKTGIGIEDIAFAQGQRAMQPYVADEATTGADRDRAGEDAAGSDFDIIGNVDITFENGGGVDLGHEGGVYSLRGRRGYCLAFSMTFWIDPLNEAKTQAAAFDLVVRDLGRMPYTEVYEMQRELQREVIGSRDAQSGDSRRMYLLLVEHDPPVITISRRKDARDNLIASDAQLAAAGVEICETDRGGDITYHGPGQLVAYPILDLNVLGLRVHSYLRFLEQIVIDTLGEFGIEGHRDPEATGVWVKPNSKAQGSPSPGFEASTHAKISALGVRISRWVSMHGLALNVNPDLNHFDLIVPCGLAGRKVTSLQKELGDQTPSMEKTKAVLTREFRTKLKN